jgi:hypothetical protein
MGKTTEFINSGVIVNPAGGSDSNQVSGCSRQQQISIPQEACDTFQWTDNADE